ncbi:MAG: transporter substrate-binding domain-containing protein [Candidatus Magnetomorum sp.]|nr:transporter substrate-binding domain-containing protein [Candidatus Magnetomorum sp.]
MKRFMLLLAMVLAFCPNAYCGEGRVLNTASDPWPPFIDPQNPKGGLSIEIAKAAYATQGYKIKHKIKPWARAMDELKKGKIDIILNTWMTEERKAFLLYSDPYTANEIKFIKLIDNTFEFSGLASLTGKIIGTIRDYGYGSEFNNATNFRREPVSDININIRKLIAGRIDLTLEDEIVGRVAIAQNDPHLLEKIAFTNNSLSKKDMFVTSGLAHPNHKEIIDAFNKGLKVIKQNGTYAQIMKNYGIE